jgi:hypothetical protein
MTNRRSFLAAAPAAFFGVPQLPGLAFAQSESNPSDFASDVTSFWANHMNVPADQLGGTVVDLRGAPDTAGFDREPFFFYYDEKNHRLIPATDPGMKPDLKSGDALLNLQVSRYRLNPDDEVAFNKYQSGGFYLDVQQQQSRMQQMTTMAFSVFSAIFPQGVPKGKPAASAKSSGKTSAGAPSPAPSPSPAAAAGSTPTIQQASETQSISLPNGAGKASFIVFAKDKRKTAFGAIVSAMATVSNTVQPAYLPLLSLPTIAAPALSAMRALVANLQAHGGQHQWLLQGPPMDVAATQEAAASPRCLKVNSGYLVAVPKSQASKMKSSMENVQIVDGFIVPNNTNPIDVYDWIQAHPPEASYLTLYTNVKPTKLNNCNVTDMLKG